MIDQPHPRNVVARQQHPNSNHSKDSENKLLTCVACFSAFMSLLPSLAAISFN
jgi:hypothetical protein